MKNYLSQLLTPQIPEDIGSIYEEWTFFENVREKRSRVWYFIVSLVLGLLILYAVLTMNFLFAIILVLAALIFIVQFFEHPKSLQVRIGEDGIILDNRFYSYRDLKSFWIIYEPPMSKYLYIDFKNQMKKSLSIPLESANPLKVREALLNYLGEDLTRDDEESEEILSAMFRF
ncbi:hypothetical protein KKC32_01360 [Patescibacteria group bacterium]|nr:hypothetical protein [Patescibacteria group bacterium]